MKFTNNEGQQCRFVPPSYVKLVCEEGIEQSNVDVIYEVTQSGGSRYENGRPLSRPVRKLLGIVYLKGHSSGPNDGHFQDETGINATDHDPIA